MAEGELTAEQLYADLVAASRRLEIPDGGFTAKQFAEDTGLRPQAAHEILVKRIKAGELDRVWIGRSYVYYFVKKS